VRVTCCYPFELADLDAMPKKRVMPEHGEIGEKAPAQLSRWQATGPSLAVASSAVFGGLGTLLGAVILAPVIHALIRLRALTPAAASVAELVAATLGRRAGVFTATLQIIGYAVLAGLAAQNVGIQLAVHVIDDPNALAETWLWPAYAVSGLVLTTLVAFALPSRVVAGIVAVLTAVGLLIFFYLAIAVIANTVSGAAPVVTAGGEQPTTGFATASALAVLAVGLVGFDVVTTHNREVQSLGRPMGLAVGAVAVVALLVWYADHVGGAGDLRLDARQFVFVVIEMYPDLGLMSMMIGAGCLAVAVLLALMWAIVRLVDGLDTRVVSPEAALVVLLGFMVVLVVARCRDWAGIDEATDYVGEFLLVVVYAAVLEASARIPGDSSLIWWSRILAPSALGVVVLLPVVNSRFAVAALLPLAIVAVLVAVAAAVSMSSAREPAD
jgi:hypothetical protein